MNSYDNTYDDIIHLPHPEPQNRRRMPVEARAAQFAPFSALTGYDEAIDETALRNLEKYTRPADDPNSDPYPEEL